MTDNKIEVVKCPDDGEICTMTEEEKKGQGCWLCPKIQGALEKAKNERDRKGELDNGRKETKE